MIDPSLIAELMRRADDEIPEPLEDGTRVYWGLGEEGKNLLVLDGENLSISLECPYDPTDTTYVHSFAGVPEFASVFWLVDRWQELRSIQLIRDARQKYGRGSYSYELEDDEYDLPLDKEEILRFAREFMSNGIDVESPSDDELFEEVDDPDGTIRQLLARNAEQALRIEELEGLLKDGSDSFSGAEEKINALISELETVKRNSVHLTDRNERQAATISEYRTEVADLKEDLKGHQSQVNVLMEVSTQRVKKITELEKQVEELQRENDSLSSENDRLNNELDAATEEIEVLREDIESLEVELEDDHSLDFGEDVAGNAPFGGVTPVRDLPPSGGRVDPEIPEGAIEPSGDEEEVNEPLTEEIESIESDRWQKLPSGLLKNLVDEDGNIIKGDE